MSSRILISANRVAVSRPGYDVIGSPSTPDYMALDSNFGRPVRLLRTGNVQGTPRNATRINYTTTYSAPPFVEVYLRSDPNTATPQYLQNMFLRLNNGVLQYTASDMKIRMTTSYFEFLQVLSGASDMLGGADLVRTYTYFVYEPNG